MSIVIDIHKKLGKFALQVSFEAGGGVTGLLGASGCGKSMTLKCIAGIEKPDKGKIVLDGVILFDSDRRINLTPQKRRVGYLFQNYALFPNMNARENILCGLRDGRSAEKERRLSEILDMMQLRGLEKHKPHQLSGGQQQRVALARIIIGNPNLLMLDEPFSALDSHLRTHLQIQMLELLNKYRKNTLMVTHNRDEAYTLCDHIALIENGTMFSFRGTRDLFSDPISRRAASITGCRNIVDARKAGENEVEVPAWGVRFTTKQPIRDGLCAIGVFAHYFNPKSPNNSFPVRITSMMEEPFEYLLQFRYENQDGPSPDIWWKAPKYRRGERNPSELGIDPSNILPLYE